MSHVSSTTSGHEAIAIIGIGCRFPGAPDPEAFWRVLRDEIETVGDYPGGRFESIDRAYSTGPVASRRGGFLTAPDQFDAGFFGISPREAALLDPQQRLLLEVAWEAVEDAGIPASKLAGSRTGVFIGLWAGDYEACAGELAHELDFYKTTGGGRYPASGRLAYFLDLRGPAVTLDTACSSSLVAIHMACRSLRSGESGMALAGGVNVILRPDITLMYSAARMLAPDGRCKFGDAQANGYVRSEGAGILLLKPLSRALADGDPVYALIRGSAVNNDGRSSGLMVSPSREGQETMLEAALHDAGVTADAIDYIEAHGTGTSAGDPVEIAAVGNVMKRSRRLRPCAIGSVKTNIGHTESAAGAAGVIKVALSLERRILPASLHFRVPSPKIAWSEFPVVMQSATAPWPQTDSPALAGISGFGITGTNAHIVLERAEEPRSIEPGREGVHLFLLSGHTPEALKAVAGNWRERLAADNAWPASLADLAYTAAARRTHHDFRLAVTARDRAELADRLGGWLSAEQSAGVQCGRRSTAARGKTVFIFPGQGGQWAGMGRSLWREEPVFQRSMAACDQAIQKHAGWSVIERLMADDGWTQEIDVVQPALFAVMVSLAELWRSWGIEPQAVVGHSMGESAAAAVSGALPLEDAAAVICHRSRLMKRASGRGLMAVAELRLEDAEKLIRDYNGRISVAANNSPTSTVLSGDADAIEDVLARMESQEVFCRRIKVDVASHCAHMDPFLAELAGSLAGIQPRPGSVPLYSTATGTIERGAGLNADYWSANLRRPVLFSSAVQNLLRDGFDTFIEVNAHPVLLAAMESGIRHAEADAVAIASLRRDKDERSELLDALGALYVSGYPVDFARLYPGGTCLRLPVYPWQRERHWLDAHGRTRAPGAHPDLGAHIESSIGPRTHFWEVDVRRAADPVAWYLEIVLAAAGEALGTTSFSLENLRFPSDPTSDGTGQLALVPAREGWWELRISARAGESWTVLCEGSLRPATDPVGLAPLEEYSEREVTPGALDPVSACLKLDTACRITGIARMEWRGPIPEAKLLARTALRDTEFGADADCRLEREDGTTVLAASGVRVEPLSSPDPAEHIYELRWVNGEPLPTAPAGQGMWILTGEPGGTAARIAAALNAAGDECISLANAEDVGQVLESAGALCRGVVYVQETDDGPEAAVRLTSAILPLVGVLAAGGSDTSPRLWLITTGAWGKTVSAAQGAVWGLGRVITREHPELRSVNVDLSSPPGDEELGTLARFMRANGPEDQAVVRGDGYSVARLDRSAGPAAPASFPSDATYLVTGGLGGIGLKVARWLVERGARHLALAGRRPPSEEARERIAQMEASGAAVRTFSLDVADPGQLASGLAEMASSMPPLRGIFHAAAVIDDALLVHTGADQVRRVMLPKAHGAWNLHRLTEGLPLDCFVLFSSIAATISQPGQGSYAAANAFLDALARHRTARGLPAVSIQWGVWAGTGLARAEGTRRSARDYRQRGIQSLSPAFGLAALELALSRGAASLLVAPIRWDVFAAAHEPLGPPRMFSNLTLRAGAALETERQSLRELLQKAEPGRQRKLLLETHLREQLALVLKLTSARIDPLKPMGSMGVDSLMALEFVRRLSASAGVRLPATAVFNFCTIDALAAEVARRMEVALDVPREEPRELPTPAGALPDLQQLSEEEAISALIRATE